VFVRSIQNNRTANLLAAAPLATPLAMRWQRCWYCLRNPSSRRSDGTDFLVEELIPGFSLSEMLISGPLPEREIINLGSQLIGGSARAGHRPPRRVAMSGMRIKNEPGGSPLAVQEPAEQNLITLCHGRHRAFTVDRWRLTH
jgi:hypothetical protein